ncbi:hypothetical protein [Catelliglobosispora koreensis]|uniref:hypothetical protein n=1 Tax=Catelliglobosispora koreensis TaxID=129052 RepID=UPI00036C8923|nr:hypothetical protein [Catelliglobosispora koreensis]
MTEDRSTDDETLAWSLATNCLLYEEDPGPRLLNIGSPTEPKMVPRREAWRELYSRLLLENIDADQARLETALSGCREQLAQCPEGQIKPVWECAVDLCEQALGMIRGAEVQDEATRERFLASVRHANTSDVLRPFPELVEDSAQDLIKQLGKLEDK